MSLCVNVKVVKFTTKMALYLILLSDLLFKLQIFFFLNNLFKFTSIHYFSRTLKNSRFTLYTPIQSSIMKRISLKKTYNTFLFFLYQTCVLMFTTSGCMCMHVSDEYGNRKKLEAHFPHKLTSIRFTDSFRNRFLL